jgi:DNA-binding MarR family transcriptional regulator
MDVSGINIGTGHLPSDIILGAMRAGHLAERTLASVLRPHDLTPASFNVLNVLQRAGRPLCPSTIGQLLLVTRGTMTGLIDSLERREYVIRIPHPEDGRMTLIAVTPAGVSLLEDLSQAYRETAAEVVDRLSDGKPETVAATLNALQDAMDGWLLSRLGD